MDFGGTPAITNENGKVVAGCDIEVMARFSKQARLAPAMTLLRHIVEVSLDWTRA